MAVIFFAVQRTIDGFPYGAGGGRFWFPGRSVRGWSGALVYDASWYLPFRNRPAFRIVRHWTAFPVALCRLAVLAIALPLLAFFKGWIEEKRQYLEMLPVLGRY